MGVRELDTGTGELLGRVEDGVAVLTLNRPQVRNALSDTLSPALRRALATLREDAEVRALLLTGAGEAFCAGGDVKAIAQPRAHGRSEAEAVADLTERQRSLTGVLYELPVPTLAALAGPAAGAGMSIALACDLRIAADRAFLTTGFANVGLSGDYGISFFLTQLVGAAKAKELMFSAERIDAQTAQQLGLVNRVVPAPELPAEAWAWARRLAAGPTRAYEYMKENLDRATRTPLSVCLECEALGTVRSARTQDHRDAVRAFVDKRAARFQGR